MLKFNFPVLKRFSVLKSSGVAKLLRAQKHFSVLNQKNTRAQTAQALSLRIRLADFRIAIYV